MKNETTVTSAESDEDGLAESQDSYEKEDGSEEDTLLISLRGRVSTSQTSEEDSPISAQNDTSSQQEDPLSLARRKKTAAPAEEKPLERPVRKRPKTATVPEIRFDPDAVFRENPYYIRLAAKYRVVKYITILLAIAFAVVMLTAFSADITTENFQYLIKDLDLSGLTSEGDFDSLVFSASSDSSFALYRGELVVLSSGVTELYRPSGVLSLRQSNIFYSPSLLTSEKYFLVYDRGDTSRTYTVFNSFAALKTEQMAYPITGAALSDEGSYAIVTRDDSYRGVVKVYDRDFKPVMTVKKDNYVLSVDLSSDGKQLVLATVTDRNGSFEAELSVVLAGADKAEVTLTVPDSMPLRVEWVESGDFAVTYTDRIVLYRADGSERAALRYESTLSLSASVGESLIATVHNDSVLGNDKTVSVYDHAGNSLYSESFEGELLQILPVDDTVYLLLEDSVMAINPHRGTVQTCSIPPNPNRLVSDGETLIVCYSGSAFAVHFPPDSEP